MGDLVCRRCFGDQALKRFVDANVADDATQCDFCGRRATKPIAAYVDDVADHIEDCIRKEHDNAENILPWDGAEGGYQGSWKGTWELLDDDLIELPHDNDGTLRSALCDAIGDQAWCDRDPFRLTLGERLLHSWQQFCETTKHEDRFNRRPREDREEDDLLDSEETLKVLVELFSEPGLLRRFRAGTKVFRVREGLGFSVPTELGPPPKGKAKQSRMSSAGVPMLYVAMDPDTAIKETIEATKDVTVATFKIKKRISVLDLTRLPPVPSLFEDYEPGSRDRLGFLHDFRRDFTKPIYRDDRVHYEYVPTQIVTAHLQHNLKHEGSPIAGILYPSSRLRGGKALVLFAKPDEIVGAPTSPYFPSEQWIELIDAEDRVGAVGCPPVAPDDDD